MKYISLLFILGTCFSFSAGLLLDLDATLPTVAFTVGRMTNVHLEHGEVLYFDKTIANVNAGFSPDGKFVCSVPGLYAFHFYAVTASNEKVWLELMKNNRYIVSIYGRTPGDYVDSGNSVLLELYKGDEVYIKARNNYPITLYGRGDQVYTTFTGVLLSRAGNTGISFSTGITYTSGWADHQQIVYDRVIEHGAAQVYDVRSGTFRAPTSGIYVFHYHALAESNQELWLDLYLNNEYVNSAYGKTPNEWADAGNTAIIHVNGGDTVTVRSRRKTVVYGDANSNQIYTTFTGFLLSPTLIVRDVQDRANLNELVAFSVGLASHHTQALGHVVKFDKVFINNGFGFNMQTGKFTATQNGVYVFHFHALSHKDKAIWIDLYHNFVYVNSIYGHLPSGYITGSNSATLELLLGDEVYLDIKSHDTALYGATDQVYCTFSGYFLAQETSYHPIIG